MDSGPQIGMFSRLHPTLIQEFLRAGCGQQEAELLVDIARDAEAGLLNEAEAMARVDEFLKNERTRATWVAGVSWSGAIGIGSADLIHMANEAADAVLAHPAIVATMDALVSGGALAALGTGMYFSVRLRKLPSRQAVLRRCARSLVRGEARK